MLGLNLCNQFKPFNHQLYQIKQMKRILSSLLAAAVLFFTSCDNTRELTINADGSGTFTSTTDMSSMLDLAKMSGQGDKLDEAPAMDTSIAIAKLVDSLETLTSEEKELLKKGTLSFTMNTKESKLFTKMQFPFSSFAQLQILDQAAPKVNGEAIGKVMQGAKGQEGVPDGMEDALPKGSIDDYYTTTYTNGKIEKKLVAEKYAKVGEDEGMQALKEMSGQGMSANNTIIINLPKPVKKAEGKNLTVSEDKKKVTIASPADDFFEDGNALEFLIEY
jgi:hypothetical protein